MPILKNQKDQEQFLKDVEDHEMEIAQDAGVFRTVRFKKPGTSVYCFDLITWPGHLCISGDMGTYVFRRLQDMFEFFRGDSINPSYWAEKLQATDAISGHRKFSRERFEATVKEWFDEFLFKSDGEKEDVWRDIENTVLSDENGTHESAVRAAMDFYFTRDRGPLFESKSQFLKDMRRQEKIYPFHEFWESDLMEWDYKFLWCLRAIVWGINRYDEKRGGADGF